MTWFEVALQIALILASVLPLIIALVTFVVKCTKEKNWKAIVKFAFSIIEDAESKFQSGTEKLEYAISMIKATADGIGYNISEQEIRDLIEDIISVTKQVNVINKK